jgi:hypothetical protein
VDIGRRPHDVEHRHRQAELRGELEREALELTLGQLGTRQLVVVYGDGTGYVCYVPHHAYARVCS